MVFLDAKMSLIGSSNFLNSKAEDHLIHPAGKFPDVCSTFRLVSALTGFYVY